MNTAIAQRIKELAPSYDHATLPGWHLRVIVDVLLRALVEDFHFVGDLGLSQMDRSRVDKLLADLAIFYLDTPRSGQDKLLRDKFDRFRSSYESWLHFIASDRNVSRWHLEHMVALLSRLGKNIKRNPSLQGLFETEEICQQIASFTQLTDDAPGTFYHLASAARQIGQLVRSGPLHAYAVSERPIARIVTASAPIWRLLRRDIQSLYQLTPALFEEFVAERLENMGLNIRQTGTTFTSDGGVDLIAWPKDGPFPFLLAIQVKHHSDQQRRVGPAPIKDMQAVIGSLPFHAGLIVTNTGFTPDAEWWASKSPGKIQLHDIETIRSWIQGRSLSSRLIQLPATVELTPRLSIALQ